jgi:hypothetical protein
MHNHTGETEYFSCKHVIDDGEIPIAEDNWLLCFSCSLKDPSDRDDLKSEDLVPLCRLCAAPVLERVAPDNADKLVAIKVHAHATWLRDKHLPDCPNGRWNPTKRNPLTN